MKQLHAIIEWKQNGNCVGDSIEIITYTPVLVSEYSANNPRMPLAHLRLQNLKCFFPNPYMIIGWEGKSFKYGTSQVGFKVLD